MVFSEAGITLNDRLFSFVLFKHIDYDSARL